jgi:zinc protease
MAALVIQAETKPQRFQLPNGLAVILLETHEHPVVRAALHLELTPADRPAACPDLPERFLRLLDRSDRAGRKVWESDRDQEERGIQLRASAHADGLSWQVLSRSRDQDRALGLLGDLLLRPLLDPSTWKGPGSTWEEAKAFQLRVFRPGHAILVLHGDLGLEQAKRMALLSFGSWSAISQPTPAAAPPKPKPEVQALRALLTPPNGSPNLGFTQVDLDRARRAWVGRQSLLSLDPQAQMAQALAEALGQAPLRERMESLTLQDLNR